MSFVGPGPQKTPLGDDQILPALGIKGEGVIVADVDVGEMVIPVPAGARLLRVQGSVLPATTGQIIVWLAKEAGALKVGASDYVIGYDIVSNPTGTSPAEAIGSNATIGYGQLAYNASGSIPGLFDATVAVGNAGVQTSCISKFSAFSAATTQGVGLISSIRTGAAPLEAFHIRAASPSNIRAGSIVRWEAF